MDVQLPGHDGRPSFLKGHTSDLNDCHEVAEVMYHSYLVTKPLDQKKYAIQIPQLRQEHFQFPMEASITMEQCQLCE